MVAQDNSTRCRQLIKKSKDYRATNYDDTNDWIVRVIDISIVKNRQTNRLIKRKCLQTNSRRLDKGISLV